MLIGQALNTTIDSMRYDASGNMTYRRQGSNLGHVFLIAPQHNRIETDSTVGDANKLNFFYTAEQSRDSEMPVNANDSRQRHYYYDRLNRVSGTWTIVSGQVRDHPLDCHYDPAGQMAAACDNAPWLAFDGANTSAVLMNGGNAGWHFFHAPGVDEPLMGYYRQNTDSRVLYYVTDGLGRQLAMADSSGQLQSQDQASGRDTRRYAGGTSNGQTFAADRFANPNVSGLSIFRNRIYDQASGRWTQEDPIGLAGGLNLYQFNGNNPVSNTDPFGLKVCFKGSGQEVADLKAATENATNSIILLDHRGCVAASVQSRGNKRFDAIRAKFQGLVDSPEQFTIRFTRLFDSAQIDKYLVDVYEKYFALAYPAIVSGRCQAEQVPWNLSQVVAHELNHHYTVPSTGMMDNDENRAVDAENVYNRASGRPVRCAY
jgi:RHS repeat-associated protein